MHIFNVIVVHCLYNTRHTVWPKVCVHLTGVHYGFFFSLMAFDQIVNIKLKSYKIRYNYIDRNNHEKVYTQCNTQKKYINILSEKLENAKMVVTVVAPSYCKYRTSTYYLSRLRCSNENIKVRKLFEHLLVLKKTHRSCTLEVSRKKKKRYIRVFLQET